MLAIRRAALLLSLMMLATPALGRDDGRYANSPLKSWLESLQSEFGQCCSDADGYVLSDPDWESHRGRYRVYIEGEWVLVPTGPSSHDRTAPDQRWFGSTTSTAIHAFVAASPAA